MGIYKLGLVVAVFLAILTVLEYIFAGEVDDATMRFIGLAATAILKAGLIMYYFMHINRLWRGEGAH
jgi:heme/copper-type cytochrome/quinol oxidase subunit 4